LRWIASLVGAAALLWVASHWIDLWPDTLILPRPELLIAAVVVQIPYALIRAMRLRFILDPLVARASDTPKRRFNSALLYGSGLVSFIVLIVLPLRLGELWRPIALVSGRQPGVRMTESVGAVAVERLLDGLIVIALLFGGMALGQTVVADEALMGQVRDFGLLMTGIFGLGLVVLLWVARAPDRFGARIERVAGAISPALGARLGPMAARVAGTFAVLLEPRKGAPFVIWSLVYWGVTVAQLWLVARACGLDLGVAEAAAIIAIVGLSIQLPGGPAQAGNFQIGMAMALALFVGADSPAGSSFAALMYLLSVLGAAAMALPGLVLTAIARRADGHVPPGDSPGSAPA
jgi:hypothetical protein